MATFTTYILGYLGFILLLAVFAANTLFLIDKNQWHILYQAYRRNWMPLWCGPCATLWISIIPAIAVAVFTGHYFLALAPVFVPVPAIIMFNTFAGVKKGGE